MKDEAVDSPCIAICRLAEDGICDGCGRSIDEIVAWRELSGADQRAVVEVAAARRASSIAEYLIGSGIDAWSLKPGV